MTFLCIWSISFPYLLWQTGQNYKNVTFFLLIASMYYSDQILRQWQKVNIRVYQETGHTSATRMLLLLFFHYPDPFNCFRKCKVFCFLRSKKKKTKQTPEICKSEGTHFYVIYFVHSPVHFSIGPVSKCSYCMSCTSSIKRHIYRSITIPHMSAKAGSEHILCKTCSSVAWRTHSNVSSI